MRDHTQSNYSSDVERGITDENFRRGTIAHTPLYSAFTNAAPPTLRSEVSSLVLKPSYCSSQPAYPYSTLWEQESAQARNDRMATLWHL